MAIILGGHSPNINLLGISTVYGNQSLEKTTKNAFNILASSGLDYLNIYKGVNQPLIRKPIFAPEIHGESGLDLKGIKFPKSFKKTPNGKIFYLFTLIKTYRFNFENN